MDLRPGSRLGDFTLIEELGRGGMGVVFKARDERRGDLVALKVIHRELAHDGTLMARFRREGETAGAIAHPNVVGIRAMLESPLPALVFDFVEGTTLFAEIKRRGRFSSSDAAAVGADVARGLAAIHAAGLVHRDVKPGNVLIDATGRARVADFGLARLTTSQEALTRTGEVIGTFEYLAPEQGRATSAIDGRADLYALGAMLYAATTGRPPFDGMGATLVMKHMTEPPRPPRELAPEISPRLEGLILRLLAKSPGDRPSTALEVATELDAIARGDRGARRALLAPIAFAAIALAIGVFVLARPKRDDTPTATPTPIASPVATPAPTAAPTAPAIDKKKLDAALRELATALRVLRDPKAARKPLETALQASGGRIPEAQAAPLAQAAVAIAEQASRKEPGLAPEALDAWHDEMVGALEVARALDPNVKLPPSLYEPLNHLAACAQSADRNARAADAYVFAVEIAPEKDRERGLAKLLAECAARSLERDPTRAARVREEIDVARRNSTTRPASERAWIERQDAITLRALAPPRNAEALEVLDRALAQFPDDDGLINERALTLWFLGRHDESFAGLDAAIAKRPSSGTLRLMRAQGYFSNTNPENLERARKDLLIARDDATLSEGDHVYALEWLAYAEVKLGNVARAVELMEERAPLKRETARYVLMHAAILLKAGRPDAALWLVASREELMRRPDVSGPDAELAQLVPLAKSADAAERARALAKLKEWIER